MAKKKKIKKKKDNYQAKKNRESAIEQGFYDGRFRKRVVPDKKKKERKEKARKKIKPE